MPRIAARALKPTILLSPEHFQDWFANQRQTQSSTTLLEAVPGNDDIARCRRMCIAYWTLHPPASLRLELIQDCLHARDSRVSCYAMAYLAYWRMIDEYPTLTGTQPYLESSQYCYFLEANARCLQLDNSDFAIEALAVTRLGIASLCLLDEDYEKALHQASEALFWAKEVKANILVGQIRSLLISIHLAKADLETVINLASENSSNYVPEIDVLYQQVFTALALAQLGSSQRAISQLERLAETYPLLSEPDDITACIHACLQQIKVTYALGGLDSGVVRDHHPDYWIVEAYHYLLQAEGIPRISSKYVASRMAFYQRALEHCQKHTAVDHRTSLQSAWISAYSALRQGQTAVALNTLSQISTPLSGWFDLRLLFAGLRLELALSLKHPNLSPLEPENELRQLMKEVEGVKPASSQGLADLLIRWHPLAAAYLALCPEPLVPFKKATQAVLRVGYSNAVYNLSLPPSFTYELILRSFDFDLRQGQGFVASDPGSSRNKRLALMSKNGEVDYWQPSFSAALILYGLMKVDQKAYHVQADVIYKSYGVVPFATASYRLIPMVESIDLFTKKLLAGEFGIKEYTQHCLDL
ncbi:MAG: hypothetical protein KC422_25845 [Trueperaceae bacterium]|nr:hypothetical protein [Trueperaceae bacterium]